MYNIGLFVLVRHVIGENGALLTYKTRYIYILGQQLPALGNFLDVAVS